jgi:hypothetical protein
VEADFWWGRLRWGRGRVQNSHDAFEHIHDGGFMDRGDMAPCSVKA